MSLPRTQLYLAKCDTCHRYLEENPHGQTTGRYYYLTGDQKAATRFATALTAEEAMESMGWRHNTPYLGADQCYPCWAVRKDQA